MSSILGMSKINLHKNRLCLDSENKVRLTYYDKIVTIKDNNRVLKHSIIDNVAIVSEPNYIQGCEVDVWSYCFRPSEGGGITPLTIHPNDEDLLESML